MCVCLCVCVSVFLSSRKAFYYIQRGRVQSFLAAAFLVATRTWLSSSVFLLARTYFPILYLMTLRVHLSLETEPLHGMLLAWGRATHLSGLALHELGVPRGVPAAAALPQLVHFLSHPIILVESCGEGVVQTPQLDALSHIPQS